MHRPLTAFLLALSLSPAAAQSVWTQRIMPAPAYYSSPAGKPGVYLIPTQEETSTTRIFLRSTNETTWAAVPLPHAQSIHCHNGRFIGLNRADSIIWYSDDGLTATPVTVPAYDPMGVAYGNNLWLITLSSGSILRSTDNAQSWTEHSTPASQLHSIAFGNGKFLLTAPSGGSLLTTNGLEWTLGPAVPGDDLCFEAGRYATTTHYSTTGSSWSELTGTSINPGDGYLRHGGGRFLTWFQSGSSPAVRTATTGSWSSTAFLPVLDTLYDVRCCGDLWIGITDSGKVLTSRTPALPAPAAPAATIQPAVRLTWPSEAGRTYTVQRLSGSTWVNATGFMSGTGQPMEWLAPANQPKELFRITVK